MKDLIQRLKYRVRQIPSSHKMMSTISLPGDFFGSGLFLEMSTAAEMMRKTFTTVEKILKAPRRQVFLFLTPTRPMIPGGR